MIYITGDIHGDLSRFKDKRIKKLKKGDTLIVCGDFGFIWSGDKREDKVLKRLGRKKYNILFVEGCHENFELLYKYPQEDWNGGKVRAISGRLKQLVRGSVFNIEGKKIFAFGGGQGVDHDIRKSYKTFWEEELPTDEELQNGLENLKSNENTVDYIITHEPPAVLKDYIDISTDVLQTNQLNATFSHIAENVSFKMWFFGKCHKNKSISRRYQAVFENIVPAE